MYSGAYPHQYPSHCPTPYDPGVRGSPMGPGDPCTALGVRGSPMAPGDPTMALLFAESRSHGVDLRVAMARLHDQMDDLRKKVLWTDLAYSIGLYIYFSTL